MRFSCLIILIFYVLTFAQNGSADDTGAASLKPEEKPAQIEISADHSFIANNATATESTGSNASTANSPSGPPVQATQESLEEQNLKEKTIWQPSKASQDVAPASESPADLQATSSLPSSLPPSSSPSSEPAKPARKRREKADKRPNVNATKSPCPKGCKCENDVVDCTHAHLTEIPSANDLPKNVRELNLFDNEIQRLSTIDPMPNLNKLVLRFNKISQIEPEVFKNAPNLRELDLGNNVNVKILPDNLFQPLEHLQTLKLDGCGISILENKTFEHNPHLKVLDISDNPLYVLKSSFFQHFKELEYLNLMNCKLTDIEWKSDTNLASLKSLNLSINQLEYLPDFKYAPNIETLVLDSNRFGVFNAKSFNYLTKLENLEINNNDELIDIEELTFAQQNRLKRLVISNNPHLFMISQHAFYSQYNESSFSLKELRLTRNSLHFLSEAMLTNHWAQLDVLDLKMNPWNCNCHLKWLQKYNQTKYVNELRCKSPENLRGQLLTKLDTELLVCRKMIDSLLLDKLKNVIQGFVFLLAFLVFTLAFLLIYVIQDRPNGFTRMFSSGGASTIYYQKANTKEHPILM